MTKKIYLETLKSVLDRSILHYFRNHVDVSFGPFYVFTGLSMYLFSNNIRRDQHCVKDYPVKELVNMPIFCR